MPQHAVYSTHKCWLFSTISKPWQTMEQIRESWKSNEVILFVEKCSNCSVYIQALAFLETYIIIINWGLSKRSFNTFWGLPIFVNRLPFRYGHIPWNQTLVCLAALRLNVLSKPIQIKEKIGRVWKLMQKSRLYLLYKFSEICKKTTVKAGSLTFYPLHINDLNFTEKMRRAKYVNGRALLTYLPDMLIHIE